MKALELPTLEALAERLATAKRRETEATAVRLRVEDEILKHPAVASVLEDEGTTNVGPIKLVTGYTRNWNQEELERIQTEVRPNFWPFKKEWKEDRKQSKALENMFPDLWFQIRGALTLKRKKTAVSLVKEA